jgi:hypothetical protein
MILLLKRLSTTAGGEKFIEETRRKGTNREVKPEKTQKNLPRYSKQERLDSISNSLVV